MKTTMAIALSILFACGSPHAAPKPAAPPVPPVVGASAAATAPAPAPKPGSLFERLGGLPAITAVVGEFVGRTTTDPRIMDRFFNTDATHLKAMLVEQICAATGGPCAYSGRDMKTTHGGMVLVDDEFTALVEDLTAALDKFHVGAREKGELLGALAGMKGDIVAPPDQLHPIDAKTLARAEKIKVDDPEAQRLLGAAITAGRRGQRNYAEQLFSRAEMRVGAPAVESIANVFRASAPPRVATPVEKLPMDTPAQPKLAVGTSADDEKKLEHGGALEGAILVDGMPLKGVGVVMLEPVGAKWKARTPKSRVVEQRGREFAPHVLATPVGSTVAFPNFDSIFHNVFSLSSAGAFDLGLYKNGESREVTFKKEGIVRIGCNLHSQMSAYIIVVAAPHYAVTDGAGTFKFENLAPGTYKLKAWSEHSAAPKISEVKVGAGVNQISVAMSGDAPASNPDKFGEER